MCFRFNTIFTVFISLKRTEKPQVSKILPPISDYDLCKQPQKNSWLHIFFTKISMTSILKRKFKSWKLLLSISMNDTESYPLNSYAETTTEGNPYASVIDFNI